MKCVKKYDLRLLAEEDAAKLMSSGIPSTITGHDKQPQILSDFKPDQIEVTVKNKDYPRAMIVLGNNDNMIVKTFKILTYKRSKVNKMIEQKSNEEAEDKNAK